MPRLLNILAMLLLGAFMLPASGYATTWDEPWMDQVISDADCFVLARVKSYTPDSGATITVLKTIAGEKVEGTAEVNGFSLLHLCSVSSGHGPEFYFDNVDTCYFFLKKNTQGGFSIATPSTGMAPVFDGTVYATYRHSYHQAFASIDLYEKTMQAIFNHYHGKAYDTDDIDAHIRKYLSMPPAGFAKSEVATFFNQHIALETIYHLRLPGYYSLVIPFLHDTSNFHNQVSAARALHAYNTTEAKEELVSVIADTARNNFVQVICIWTLGEFKPNELKDRLRTLLPTASTESNGFGGNIMDPRVCTHIPTVKKALEKLIEE